MLANKTKLYMIRVISTRLEPCAPQATDDMMKFREMSGMPLFCIESKGENERAEGNKDEQIYRPRRQYFVRER